VIAGRRFSLLELLAVMGVLATLVLLVGRLGAGLLRLDEFASVSRLLSAMWAQGRLMARQEGIEVAFLVESDGSMRQSVPSASLCLAALMEEGWVVQGRAERLPAGLMLGLAGGPDGREYDLGTGRDPGYRVVVDPDGRGARAFFGLGWQMDGSSGPLLRSDYWREELGGLRRPGALVLFTEGDGGAFAALNRVFDWESGCWLSADAFEGNQRGAGR
jgi:hypothetical protein